MKRALITGVTGQDGAYLSQLLLQHGYEVYGTHRPNSANSANPANSANSADSAGGSSRLRQLGVAGAVRMVALDLRDAAAIRSAVSDVRPDEIYHLAAQSSVAASFADPLATADLNAIGTLRLLEAVRTSAPDARFFQASTGEIFARDTGTPLDESAPPHPRSPYAVSKLFAHWSTIATRETQGLYACCGIMFNHESPLRGTEFVTRKISSAVARIKRAGAGELPLGNLDARRDWGFAGDYVRAVWSMLQQPRPDDYVIATGESHSVQEFVELAFRHVGLDWKAHTRADPALMRPADSGWLVGDAAKARRVLDWRPTVSFERLVAMMVDADLARLDDQSP